MELYHMLTTLFVFTNIIAYYDSLKNLPLFLYIAGSGITSNQYDIKCQELQVA